VGVPAGLVRTVLEVVREAGGSPESGMPPTVPGAVRRAPPRLDEHGAVVRQLGWAAFDALPVPAPVAEALRGPGDALGASPSTGAAAVGP
jgi:hypothetical protein